MPKASIQTKTFIQTLGSEGNSLANRCTMLADVLLQAKEGHGSCQEVAEEIFGRIESSVAHDAIHEEQKEMEEMMNMMAHAPMRAGTFVHTAAIESKYANGVLVIMDNGELCYVADNNSMCKAMKIGDRVLVDAKCKVIMGKALGELHNGHEARFERMLDDQHIEVVGSNDEKTVVLSSTDVMKQIKSGELGGGANVILGAGGRMAIYALPAESKELSHFRFLDRGGIPNVIADRDIGSPPRVIGQVGRHIREEMTRPELRRRFKLRPCKTVLMCGVSGSGKTLSRMAMHRQMYEIMSEVTGTPMEQLPPRVFIFKNSQMLSMWLGESDKNCDRMFDEVEQVAAQKYTNAKGEEFMLPVMVVMEEADGMGRARGQDHDAVYDRILSTILHRLDPNRPGLSDKLVVFLSTTNEKNMIDPAFLRRIGGSVEVFGRLDQEAFDAVLRKHVEGLPASYNGDAKKKAWNSIINDINEWLFLPGPDKGVVELYYQGSQSPVVRYHRDFLTGALVDRAVQQAATAAWELSLKDNPNSGVTRDQMITAIRDQVASVADQLCPQNVSHYLDLPEGVRVVNVRRLGK